MKEDAKRLRSDPRNLLGRFRDNAKFCGERGRFERIVRLQVQPSAPLRGDVLVLGGEGWKLRQFYTGGGLKSHLVDADMVDIVTLEAFVALANLGEL